MAAADFLTYGYLCFFNQKTETPNLYNIFFAAAL